MGSLFLSSPVCVDSLGETWTGYITEGVDKGRTVVGTVISAKSRSRAINEILETAQASLTVRHPHVLALLQVEECEEEIILTSEYLEGEPLSTLINAASQSGPFPQTVALRIVKDVIDTHLALHTLASDNDSLNLPGGLSPEAAFVATFGETMIRHPGINQVAMRQLALRRHPATLPYRSPEQLKNPRTIDQRTDVFSAGVLLWELLSSRSLFGESHEHFGRKKAFSNLSAQEIERRIRSLPIPPLSEIRRPEGALHSDVVSLVDRALRRDPSQRFADLEELSNSLSSLPPQMLADSEEVAATVDSLAGPVIARRHQQMTEIAPIPLRSSVPPSGRVSSFPDEQAQVTLAAPRRIDRLEQQELKDPGRGSGSSSSNANTNATSHPASPPKAPEVRIETKGPENFGKSFSEPTINEITGSGGPPPAIELPSFERNPPPGSWLAAAAILLGLGVGTYALWRSLGDDPETSGSQRAQETSSETRNKTTSKEEVIEAPQPSEAEEESSGTLTSPGKPSSSDTGQPARLPPSREAVPNESTSPSPPNKESQDPNSRRSPQSSTGHESDPSSPHEAFRPEGI